LFANDANGAGDTTAFLGATLDKIAEAIDGLNWQLDHNYPKEEHIGSNNDKDSSDKEIDHGSEGAKIVFADKEENDDSQDSWQVVTEE
jgi:hypothetical protein